MTRTKRFVSGVLSGYASIGVNIFFTMASIPLALYYLGKEEFGLWSLIVQLAGYLALLDLGMYVAIARFLADHKEDIDGGTYGSILKTGQAVFLIQASLIVVAGFILAVVAPGLLKIPTGYHSIFTVLIVAQCLLSACSFGTKMAGSPLWCHQRYDINNLAASSSLILNFAAMWYGFSRGLGLYSMVLGSVCGFAIGLAIPLLACIRLGFYPSKGNWGRFQWRLFREMFTFGRDIFLISLGAQLASASQLMVISRFMGLEAVATWSVAGKACMFGQQFVGRIFDSSAGGLTEMLVKGEKGRLEGRFCDLIILSTSLAVFVGSGIALFNAPFVYLWTGGRIDWPVWNDALLGVLLVCTVLTRCHTGLVGITKDIRGMKYIYLAEGAGMILLSLLLIPRAGFAGVLLAAIFCNLFITGFYAAWRSSRFFQHKIGVILLWPVRSMGLLVILYVVVFLGHSLVLKIESWMVLSVAVSCFTVVSLPFFYGFGISAGIREEIKRLMHLKKDGKPLRYI